MMAGIPFLGAAIYCTLAVAFVLTVIEVEGASLWRHTLRRWVKFLLLLLALAAAVQVLTLWQG